MHPIGLERLRGTGEAEFRCVGEQFGDVVEASVVDGGRVEVDEIGEGEPVRNGELHPAPLLRLMSSRQRNQLCPVSCMQMRTGLSSAGASGVSVGAGV